MYVFVILIVFTVPLSLSSRSFRVPFTLHDTTHSASDISSRTLSAEHSALGVLFFFYSKFVFVFRRISALCTTRYGDGNWAVGIERSLGICPRASSQSCLCRISTFIVHRTLGVIVFPTYWP
ncbi:hypothetical protein BJV77DRAFT_1023222 [Russula vinacea]|nr:hypothetical protein BJV77DRAFT_1023222 [Russula vinacea]